MVSARMLHPAVMGATNAVGRNLPCGRQMDRIKRNLFGTAQTPLTETKTVSNSFTAQLESQQELATQKWGFDFRADRPLAGNALFIWERVSSQESNFAPPMYTLTRAAHVRRDSVATPSDMNSLLDERADRENLANSSLVSHTDSEYDSQDESFNSSSDGNNISEGASTSAAALTASSSATCNSPAQQRKRQLKITEFMKERKRLTQPPKKISPAKRMRTSSGSSNVGSSSSSSSSMGAHFGSLLKRTRHN